MTAVRHQEFKGPSEPFKPPTASFYRFEFRNPDTGEKVTWTNSRDLAPVALSINDNIPELVTTPNYGTLRYRCPDPPYVAFQYIDKQRFGDPKQCSEPDNWWFAADPSAGDR